MRLSSTIHFLHFSGLSDARQGTWSDELCALLGVDREKLPRIVEPWHVVGEVAEKRPLTLGLLPGRLSLPDAEIPRRVPWVRALCGLVCFLMWRAPLRFWLLQRIHLWLIVKIAPC